MAKGSDFEREFCRQLTAWWTGDPDADVCFWRTSQSGGRATTRRKGGKKTVRAHCGDVAALDDMGKPLTDLITFELKRGYSKHTLHDLLDKPYGAALQEWEKWVSQAQEAARNAGTPYWAVVSRRDRREPLMVVTKTLYEKLMVWGMCRIACCWLYIDVDGIEMQCVVMLLREFFQLMPARGIPGRNGRD